VAHHQPLREAQAKCRLYLNSVAVREVLLIKIFGSPYTRLEAQVFQFPHHLQPQNNPPVVDFTHSVQGTSVQLSLARIFNGHIPPMLANANLPAALNIHAGHITVDLHYIRQKIDNAQARM